MTPYQEVTPENIGLFHVHGDPATFSHRAAILVIPHDAKSAAILCGRYVDPKATVQLLVPTQIVTETLDLVFKVKRFFDRTGAPPRRRNGACCSRLVLLLVHAAAARRNADDVPNRAAGRGMIFSLCKPRRFCSRAFGGGPRSPPERRGASGAASQLAYRRHTLRLPPPCQRPAVACGKRPQNAWPS